MLCIEIPVFNGKTGTSESAEQVALAAEVAEEQQTKTACELHTLPPGTIRSAQSMFSVLVRTFATLHLSLPVVLIVQQSERTRFCHMRRTHFIHNHRPNV